MNIGYLEGSVLLGLGATVVMDTWMALRKRLFGISAPDYGLVGRWVGHMPHGRFRHDRIAAAPPVRGEVAIGWITHYGTGITFAALLLAIFGVEWLSKPTLGPALAIGIATVAAPFLVMQPGMGAGIAASRTPRPASARVQSVITHGVFGLGLYVCGSLANLLG